MENEEDDEDSSPFSLYLSIATALTVVFSVALSLSDGELTPLTFIGYCFAAVFVFSICIAIIIGGMRLYGVLFPTDDDSEYSTKTSDIIVFFSLMFLGVIAGLVSLDLLFSIAGIEQEIGVIELIVDLFRPQSF